MEVLFMSLMVVITFFVMIPRPWRRRAFGYVNAADFLAAMFVVTHFMSGGAAALSLYIGVMAMLGLTISLRYGRAQFGSEKLELNGDCSISAVVAGVMTQGVRWGRALFIASFNGGVITKPTPLDWRWVQDWEPARNFWAGNARFWSTV